MIPQRLHPLRRLFAAMLVAALPFVGAAMPLMSARALAAGMDGAAVHGTDGHHHPGHGSHAHPAECCDLCVAACGACAVAATATHTSLRPAPRIGAPRVASVWRAPRWARARLLPFPVGPPSLRA
jgi:hypothetical protein